MEFTDPEKIQARARAVRALLPKDPDVKLTHSETRVRVTSAVDPSEPTVFDAVRGTLRWQDMDGERRTLALPGGITTESVAALLWGLGHVEDWA